MSVRERRPEYLTVWNRRYQFQSVYDRRLCYHSISDHHNAKMLLYIGIYAYFEVSHRRELRLAEFVDFYFEHFKNMAPIHQWIRKVLDQHEG